MNLVCHPLRQQSEARPGALCAPYFSILPRRAAPRAGISGASAPQKSQFRDKPAGHIASALIRLEYKHTESLPDFFKTPLNRWYNGVSARICRGSIMPYWSLRQALLSSLFLIWCGAIGPAAIAQETSAPIDFRNPPQGYVPPKADGARDMSMAKYARDSFLDGEEGVVDLRLLVRRDGFVADSELQTSSGSARLDKYARDLVKDWHFQPATVNGSPVDAWHLVNVVWALQTIGFGLGPGVLQSMMRTYMNDPVVNRIQGTTTARLLIRDGTVQKVIIDRSSGHAAIDNLTTKALSALRYNLPSATPGDATWSRYTISWYIRELRPVERDACLQDKALDSESTIAACSRALADPSMTAYQRAEALLERGETHFWRREFDAAIADLDSGIRSSPGMSALFIGRARARLAMNQRDLAMSDLDSAAMVEPLAYDPYVARAEAALASGDANRAMLDYRTALTTPGKGALSAVCYSLSKMGRAQEALEGCNKAVSLNPKNDSALEARAFAHLKLGQYREAIADYDAALRNDNPRAASLYGRGVAKLKSGDVRGQGDLGAAQKLDPVIAEKMAQDGVTP